MCEINLEAELFTLQDSNAKLVAALQEANSSVEQWKKQLAEYQEETDRLRDQVTLCSAQRSNYSRLKLSLFQSVFEEIHIILWRWHWRCFHSLGKNDRGLIDLLIQNFIWSHFMKHDNETTNETYWSKRKYSAISKP